MSSPSYTNNSNNQSYHHQMMTLHDQNPYSSPNPNNSMMADEDSARTEYYRRRINAFYRHYQPDKPGSHVEFLLCKYKGLEEEVLGTLREKYGPEPQADGTLFSSGGGRGGGSKSNNNRGTIGIHREDGNTSTPSAALNNSSTALDDANSNLMKQLEDKQSIFQRDMWLLQEQSKRAEASAIGVSLQDARRVAQKQEVELQQLRHTLSALKSEYAAKCEAQKDDIEKASRDLTLAKLKHMQASTALASRSRSNNNNNSRSGSASSDNNNNNSDNWKVPRVPLDEMHGTTDAMGAVESNLKSTVDYGRKLVAVLQKHLFLYPMSPVRMTLEELDPSLAARLEVNMNAAQQVAQQDS